MGDGVNIAYNLAGGGPSTMYFNGEVSNIPTTSKESIIERSVGDIVYIGYPNTKEIHSKNRILIFTNHPGLFVIRRYL